MDRYLIVSTDGHAGLPMADYRDYLDSQYHEEFDRMLPIQVAETRESEKLFLLDTFNDKWRAEAGPNLKGAWDSDARNQVCDGDGIVAEVLFPDGITEMNSPPFGGGLGLRPMTSPKEIELQWAGVKAHNRWMAEFCAMEPDRRIGLAIILPLYDVDMALEEIKLAHKNGMKGILIPSLNGPYTTYNDPCFYPIWEYCQEHELVVHTHSGPAPDRDFALPGAVGTYMCEFAWWAARPIWYMIFGGVYEKFPRLKFALTEVSEFWIPSMLEMMDVRASVKHTTGKMGDFRSNLTMLPSEYFQRNCWVSASALFDEGSMAVRHQIGIDSVMWGSDYPHPEGSWPRTKEKLLTYMKGTPEEELNKMFSINAVECYSLDVNILNPIAERVGPLKSDFVVDGADAA